MQSEPALRHEDMQGRPTPLRGVLDLVERELTAQSAVGDFVTFHDGSYRRWLERAR